MNNLRRRWQTRIDSTLAADVIPVGTQRILVAVILVLFVGLRLWTVGNVSLDRTHWKEIDYVMVSSSYWQHGYGFLWPEVTWPAAPPSVTEMEFPIVPYTAALLYSVFGYNVYSVRLIVVLAWLVLIVYIWRLATKEMGPVVGLVAALVAGLMTLYHPFGRFLLSEPIVVTVSVVAVFHFAQWLELRRRRDWLLSALAFTLAISLKPDTLYLLLPLTWIVFRRFRWRLNEYTSLFVLTLAALVLPVLWYYHAHYLETIGVHEFGIFSGHDKFQTLTMVTNPGWYKTMAGRVGGQILGGETGIALCVAGILTAIWQRKGDLFVAYLLAICAFFVIVAEGNFDAPYRQLTAIPPLSVFVALGTAVVFAAVVELARTFRSLRGSRWPYVAGVLVACLLLVFAHPVRRNHILFWDSSKPIHPDRWEFAQQARPLIGSDAKLVVAGEYSIHEGGNDVSPVLFYYLGVQGWNLQPQDWDLGSVEAFIGQGATHFVAVPPHGESESGPFLGDEAGERFVDSLKARYQLVYQRGNWLVLDLRKPASHSRDHEPSVRTVCCLG